MPRSIRSLAPGLLAAVSMLALGACTTVGPDFKRPAAPAAAGFGMAGDIAAPGVTLSPQTQAAGPWWTALGSPQLDATIRQALAESPTVAEAEANLAKARAQLEAVRGEGGLQADATAGAHRERINTQAFGITGFPSPTINLYSIGATVSYDLDLFGGQRRADEAAAARLEAQSQRAEAAYLTLTGNIALQAVQIAVLREQLATLDTMTADDRQILDMVRRAEAAGGASPSASTSGEAQLAQDEALAPPLRRQLAEARHQMALLVGKAPAEWTAPDFDLAALTAPATIPVSLPSSLVRTRPDILAAEAELHAATADIGVSTAALYPNIDLAAGLTQTALQPDKLFNYASSGWTLGAGLTAPLFHGGTLRANKRATEAEARAAMARYQQTVLGAFVQVSNVLSALGTDAQSLAALDRAQAAAQSNLHDARAAYDLGGGALYAVIDAQRQLNQVRRQGIDARGRQLADVVALFGATAADWR